MESGKNQKWSKLKVVTSGQKKEVLEIESGQNRKWLKWKVVKI